MELLKFVKFYDRQNKSTEMSTIDMLVTNQLNSNVI